MLKSPAPIVNAVALLAAGLLVLIGAPSPGRAADELELYQQRLQHLFRQLDRDADGRLDQDEVRTNPYLKRHFRRLDRGGKGHLLPGDLR